MSKNKGDRAYGKGQKDSRKARRDSTINPLTTMFHSHYRPSSGQQKSYDKGWKNDRKQSSGCFITTACVEARGLPDDCRELQVLRRFRDDYMRRLPGGEEMVGEYYLVAPGIVARVNQSLDRRAVYDDLFGRLVERSVVLITAGRNNEALENYRRIVEELRAKYS